MSVTMKNFWTPIAPIVCLKGGAAYCASEVVNNQVDSRGWQVPYSTVVIVAGSILCFKGYVTEYPWIGNFCLQAAVPLALKAVNIVTPKGNCKWIDTNNRWEVNISVKYGETSGDLLIFKNPDTQKWQSLTHTEYEDFTVDPLIQLRVRQVCKALFSGAAFSLPLLAYKGSA
ncbi:MAG: hypothetical protein KDK71_08295 [Chlamydiia bacterium]|nr:hypothetical protein [Chlamydiia bacterium]